MVYIVIKTANSPRPGTWILERSTDFGQTYTPWYYFAPSRSECFDMFNINTRLPLVEDDQVMCITKYSQIPPFENGEMYISLVNGRPSALRNQVTPKLQVNYVALHATKGWGGIIVTLICDIRFDLQTRKI